MAKKPSDADYFYNGPDKRKPFLSLLDGDIIAVKSAAIFCSQSGVEEEELYAIVRKTVQEWASISQCDDYRICMSLGRCFRYEAYPQYKSNRKGEKPRGTDEAKAYLRSAWPCLEYNGLEADDVMGIYATEPDTEQVRVIVSTDKDMLQIPCWQVNPDKDRFPYLRGKEEAHKFLWYQWTCGDPGDGYPGIPGYGLAKFKKWWPDGGNIYSLFSQHGQDDSYCTAMRSCARILQWEDRPEGFPPLHTLQETPF